MSQTQRSAKTKKASRRTYSPEFRRMAVERMKTCDNVSELARELKIRRKWLYKWKNDALKQGAILAGGGAKMAPEDDGEGCICKLQTRIADLERLAGQQALDIVFFKTALRHLEEIRRKKGKPGVKASIK